jgi:hypothetical protein
MRFFTVGMETICIGQQHVYENHTKTDCSQPFAELGTEVTPPGAVCDPQVRFRHGTALHCTALHCTALHCTALQYQYGWGEWCSMLRPPSATLRCGLQCYRCGCGGGACGRPRPLRANQSQGAP